MVSKQLLLNTPTKKKKEKKYLSTPIHFGKPPFSTLLIHPVEEPCIYVNASQT